MGKKSIRALVIFFLTLIVIVLVFVVLIMQVRTGQLPGVGIFLANNPVLSHLAIVPSFQPLNLHHQNTQTGTMLKFKGIITRLIPQGNIYQIEVNIGNAYPLPLNVVLGMTDGSMVVGHLQSDGTTVFGKEKSSDLISTLSIGRPITIFIFSNNNPTSDTDKKYQLSQLTSIQKVEAYGQSGKKTNEFFVQANEFIYDP